MTDDILAPIGKPLAVELIPPADLCIDSNYQRSIDNRASQRQIDRMRRQWDWRLCVPLMVSRRLDGLYVIDGQRRMTAAQRRGDIPYLPCLVGRYDSIADEAAIFVEANSTPQKVHRVDAWRAAVLAGDPHALAVDRVVQAAGLELVPTSLNGLRAGQINALSVVRTTIKNRGEEVAVRVFTVLADAYPTHVIPNIGVYCAALSGLLAVDGISADALTSALRRAVPCRWLDRAKDHPAWDAGPGFATALRAVLRATITGDPQALRAGTAVSRPPPPRPTASPAPAPMPAPSVAPDEPPNFEDRLAAIAAGTARVVPAFKPSRPDPAGTLGGVASGMI